MKHTITITYDDESHSATIDGPGGGKPIALSGASITWTREPIEDYAAEVISGYRRLKAGPVLQFNVVGQIG